MKKFLIVKTSSLGDIIHVYPVVDYLKTRFPNCQIDWVVEKRFADLVSTHPEISKTFCIDTHGWRKSPFSPHTFKEIFCLRNALQATEYDCVFDLQGNTKSAIFTFLARSLHKVGFASPAVFEWPNLLVTNQRYTPPKGLNARQEYLYLVKSFFKDTAEFHERSILLTISQEEKERIKFILEGKKRPVVIVCAGSAWTNKQMTEDALFTLLAGVQAEIHCQFLLTWGSQSEMEAAQRLEKRFPQSAFLIERLPLPTLQNLMNQVDLILAMDSLPLHLAGTTKTSTFSIFGASKSNKFKPEGANHKAYQGQCPYGRTFERRCPILRSCPTGACIRALSGHEVLIHFTNSRVYRS